MKRTDFTKMAFMMPEEVYNLGYEDGLADSIVENIDQVTTKRNERIEDVKKGIMHAMYILTQNTKGDIDPNIGVDMTLTQLEIELESDDLKI